MLYMRLWLWTLCAQSTMQFCQTWYVGDCSFATLARFRNCTLARSAAAARLSSAFVPHLLVAQRGRQVLADMHG